MAESPITARSQDFAAWYQDVVLAGDMAEPAEIVKGCMVIKANGYAVWEALQRELDSRFKASGHQNMYFPLLIPQSFMHKEAEHVEGFHRALDFVARERKYLAFLEAPPLDSTRQFVMHRRFKSEVQQVSIDGMAE